MKLIGNNLSQTERLRMQLENSVHKVITSYENEDLLAVQMTRDDLSFIIEILRKACKDENPSARTIFR